MVGILTCKYSFLKGRADVPYFPFSAQVRDKVTAKWHMIPDGVCLSAVTVETASGMYSRLKLIVGY